MKKNDRKIKKIIVNLITGIRTLGTIAIIPIFANLGYLGASIAALGIFATDFIDGKLARKFHVESFFGSLLDGISDKMFGIVCLSILAVSNPAFIPVIFLELGILFVNFKSIQRGNNTKSSYLGKIKTVLLAITIIGSLFCYAIPSLKDVFNYIEVFNLSKLSEINSEKVSSILASLTILSDIAVLCDYEVKAKRQDEKKEQEITIQACKNLEIKKIELSIEKIEEEKDKLKEQKKELEKKLELKSKKELLNDLFDTDFYIEHKDDSIKRLIYK